MLVLAIAACQDADGLNPDKDSDAQDTTSDSENKLRDDKGTGGHDPDDDSSDTDTGGDQNNSDGKGKDDKGGKGGKDTNRPDLPFEPPEPQLRALLKVQYKASVQDLLGPAAAAKAAPPSDPNPINGFASIGASQLSIDSAAVEQYESSAAAIAKVAAADTKRIDGLAKCTPKKGKDCFSSFVTNFGALAFRRPLSGQERARYTKILPDASYYERVEIAIAAMLQSPYFLYQIEVGKADKGDKGKYKLTGYELATRLSYFLLGTTPSPELMAAAKAGELDTEKGVRAVAAEMLEDPKARKAIQAFWYELLDFSHIEENSKDKSVFKMWSKALANSVKQETLTFLDKLVWEGSGNFKEMWTADYTYVNRDMASLYGISTKNKNQSFVKVELPEGSKRAGLLGQASFLSSVSHSTTTSPTLRGKHVMEKFLCVTIPAPPPDAATEFKPTSGKAKTKIELLEEHVSNPSCQGCHQYMDPIGLGLENFDAIGRFRFEENGIKLETRHDAASLGEFDGAQELGAMIAEDERSVECFTRNLFRFATGHIETVGEEGAILDIAKAFEEADYDIPALLVEIVANPAFRYVGAINE